MLFFKAKKSCEGYFFVVVFQAATVIQSRKKIILFSINNNSLSEMCQNSNQTGISIQANEP